MAGRRIFHLCFVVLCIFILCSIVNSDSSVSASGSESQNVYHMWIRRADESAVNITTPSGTESPSVSPTNSTIPKNYTTPEYVGFICAGVAVVFFGSNFVPVKKFESGDGMFFQWILCAAIWLTGLVVHAVRNFPTFYPLAMLGGFLWATGNVTVVPIIKTIGLSMGILIWGTFNLLAGWASGRFGWFGLKPTTLSNDVLNDIGVCFAVLSAFIYMFVKSEVSSANTSDKLNEERENLISDNVNTEEGDQQVIVIQESFFEKLSPTKKRIFGICLSVGAGLLYGMNFAPVIYVQQNYPGASPNSLDYVFAHFCGILATSSLYFIIYCMLKKNNPSLYPKLVLPAFASGMMWAIADICWFVANEALSEAISFPIITTGPGIVASLWGVLVFREIRGVRNLLVLLLAFTITITGVILTAFSM